jgi:hypothetical protein
MPLSVQIDFALPMEDFDYLIAERRTAHSPLGSLAYDSDDGESRKSDHQETSSNKRDMMSKRRRSIVDFHSSSDLGVDVEPQARRSRASSQSQPHSLIDIASNDSITEETASPAVKRGRGRPRIHNRDPPATPSSEDKTKKAAKDKKAEKEKDKDKDVIEEEEEEEEEEFTKPTEYSRRTRSSKKK